MITATFGGVDAVRFAHHLPQVLPVVCAQAWRKGPFGSNNAALCSAGFDPDGHRNLAGLLPVTMRITASAPTGRRYRLERKHIFHVWEEMLFNYPPRSVSRPSNASEY